MRRWSVTILAHHKIMKKLLILLLLGLLWTRVECSELKLFWTNSSPSTIAGYKLHLSFGRPTNFFVVDVGNVNITKISVSTGPVYSFYVTAYDTNKLESDPSNQIRYQQFLIKTGIGRKNPIRLSGTTNWATATLVQVPKTGVFTGNPPDIKYFVTGFLPTGRDRFVYKLSETWQGEYITNYYEVYGPPTYRPY